HCQAGTRRERIMMGKVIQGSFLAGQPRLPAQPKIAPSPSRIMQPSVSPRMMPSSVKPRAAAHPPGPSVPAYAGRQGTAQRHGAGGAFAVEPGQLGLAAGGGRPLPEVVRGRMEAALGTDFSNVRVHVGPQAERIGAIAFT